VVNAMMTLSLAATTLDVVAHTVTTQSL